MDQKFLAKRLERLGTETAFEVLARAKALEKEGKSIVHFEIGEPDFETPKHIVEEAITALRNGKTHYTPANGLLSLRETISRHIQRSRNIPCDPDEVVVTPGAKPIMFFSLLACVNEGDEVIYPNPGFPIYESMIRFVGGVPVPLPLYESKQFRFDSEELRKLITPRTKMIIINSPHNPTGGILTKTELTVLAELSQKNDILIFSDEIYDGILYEGTHESIISFPGMKERTIILAGHSKNYAMTGWRMGYGIFPRSIAVMVTKLAVNSVSSTAEFTQYAAQAALEGSQEPVKEMVAQWKTRRDFMVKELQSMGLSCQTPQGAFYVFPNVSNLSMDSQKVVDFLLKESGVALLDGGCFGKFGKGHIRLSYATSMANITEGLKRMKEGISRIRHEHSPSQGIPQNSQNGERLEENWEIHNPNGVKRVLVTRRMPGTKWLPLLLSENFRVEISKKDHVLSQEEISRAIGDRCDAVIGQLTEKWDKTLFQKLSKAGGKAYSNMAVGYDNVSVDVASELGIAVGNTPGVLTETTAEMAVSLTFACARKIPQADQFMRTGKYEGWDPSLFLGARLHGGTVGIVGAGRIGAAFAQMMAFGHRMNVVYYDPYPNVGMETRIREFNSLGTQEGLPAITCRRVDSVEEIFPVADVLSLHTVLSPSTHHLINAKNLKKMKKNAILINTSRGPVIDETALVEHCKAHPSFSAALDVFENEPRMAPGLSELSNVIVVPHIASATEWTRSGMASLAAANIRAVLKGHPMWDSANVEAFVDGNTEIPKAAPSIVNANKVGLAVPSAE